MNIYYNGGSGGFILFHTLLLSNNYATVLYVPSIRKNLKIDNSEKLGPIIKKQWNLENISQWKNFECWPDNNETLNKKSNKEKITFICNSNEVWENIDNKANVCIYTDIKTQLRMCIEKKAYWFAKEFDKRIFDIDDIPLEYYQGSKFTLIKKILSLKKEYNNTYVTERSLHAINKSDIVVNLQEFINYPKYTLKEKFNLDINQKQIDLINHWKSLHPPKLLQKCGFNLDDISY